MHPKIFNMKLVKNVDKYVIEQRDKYIRKVYRYTRYIYSITRLTTRYERIDKLQLAQLINDTVYKLIMHT